MNARLIKRLIESHRAQDERAFSDTARQVIALERRQGHDRIADELQGALDARQQTFEPPSGLRGHANAAKVLELPGARHEELPFLEVRSARYDLGVIVLAPDTKAQVERFLHEYSHRGRLAEHGLEPMRKLLFHGPPGNGKTLCAEVIAGELGLPLYYVRFDALIASYLGETSANLRRVFDIARRRAGVLFFDEVDAIARTRDEQGDVGEIKRVVNSFLQMLDGDESEGPIIAATNHERSLDAAIWRRFDDVISFPRPGVRELSEYLSRRLRAVSASEISVDEAAASCATLNLSDVARIVSDALKTMVLAGEKTLTRAMFQQAVERHQASRSTKG